MRNFYIDPDIEAYGTYARVSSLADYFEVAALNNSNYSFSEMSEIIKDSGWLDTELSLIIDTDKAISDESESTKIEDWENVMQTTITQRMSELGGKYPFKLEESRLVQKKFHRKHTIYLKFLGISFLHAFKIDEIFSSKNLADIFERSVTQCLVEKGLYGKNFGTAGNSSGNFLDRVNEAFTPYGFAENHSAVYKKYAKDEKLDTIAGVSWGNGRNFNQHWMFLGQSTISKSSEWERKMKELDCNYWADLLETNIVPQKFFSTPYHITDDYFEYLIKCSSGIILDRINLTKNLKRFTSEDVKLYNHLKSLQQSDE